MSITKIPEYLLKTFKCAQCGSYLSSSPIGTRTDGTNVCSICYDETATRCFLFENLATLHKFPCNYKSQGCVEYFPFNNIAHHEANCTHRVYLCPANYLYSPCSWKGIASQIYTHYKKQHPELRLKHPSFKINFSNESECYSHILSINQVNLILIAEHCVQSNILRFDAVYIGDVSKAELIKYRVKLSNSNSGRIMELEENSTLPLTELHQPILREAKQIDVVDLIGFLQNPQIIQCEWSFTIPDSLKQIKTIKYTTEQMKCPNCSFSMVPPVYRCTVGHVSCNDCKGYENFCKLCQEINIDFSRAVDLEDITIDSLYYCQWKDCLHCFNSFSIKQHEQECSKRLYQCPICFKPIGTFNYVFKHFCSEHVQIKLILAPNNLVKLSKKNDYCYVFASRELFKVSILENDEFQWTIDIVYCGIPSLNNWKYEVVRNCNSLHYASKLYNNHYRLEHDEYSTTNHTHCYFSIRFIKPVTSMMWMPYEPPSKKTCIDFDIDY